VYHVRVSAIAPITADQVETRLAAKNISPDLAVLPIRPSVEPVLRSVIADDMDHALLWLAIWSRRADVRAGRARVCIVEVPGSRAEVA